MASGAVHIEGLAEFRRALRKIDSDLPNGVREGLKSAAEIVAVEARKRAPVRSGLTRGKTRAFTSGNKAGVRTTARKRSRAYPSGYPYPRRFEYGDLRKPFLGPALEAKRDEVIRRLDDVLDDVAQTWEG